MTITRSEAAFLGRQAERPVKAAGELLALWVPGKLANPLNGTPWIWHKRTRYAKAWKERTAMALLEGGWRCAQGLQALGPTARATKRVAFTARTHNEMDSDGLQAALKPIRDALVMCGVLTGDAPQHGHEFVYEQRIDRARRGVEIRISLRGQA